MIMIGRIESWFDDDFHSSRNQVLGSDSESFAWNGDDLPVNVLFTTFVTTAPVDMALAVSFDGPVGSALTFFGAVGPLLATATQFGGKSTKLKTVGTVPGRRIFFQL